ncbi:relaxase/mobilization nuclease domain-containing protein [Senegalia sp. (in: firmicutes)]|uniref:relaxase/mobilization nuclease domain-containing protein n=1 Tax=Senegalia sp. (in: firmicutes) TaxID=1924098 RepID=UPI003F955439
MAITKIHPIKTTLDKSIDYICDKDKIDENILISTFACGHETASIEFDLTRKNWNSSSKNLARHLIQSFDPEDNLTPKLAHEIGIKLAEKALNGKYEYVLTTHIDKGHIHNHILFNNVSFIDGRAYNSNKKSYHQIRNISDKLCKDYNLNIILEPKKSGKSYKEYSEFKKGTSWKAKLQYSIDNTIKRAKDWDDFLRLMEQMGYEIKKGKHISFRAKEQQRFTRSKTIGEEYTQENIISRIEKYQNYKSNIKNKAKKYFNKRDKIDNVIDLKNNDKAKEFRGYAIWAKQHNLKNMAKILNLMNIYEITSYEDLSFILESNNLNLMKVASEIKDIENESEALAIKIKYIETYKKYKSTFIEFKKTDNKDLYYKSHANELLLYKAAKAYLDDLESSNTLPSIPKLKDKLKELERSKKELMNEYNNKKEKVSELNFVKLNLETYMQWKEATLNMKRNH